LDAALIASASVLGLVGAPHCTAMCSAPCAAAIGGGGRPAALAFQLARVASYAAGGALAAASVGALASWGQLSPALRPAWVLLNSLALLLGLSLLVTARQPHWLARWGRVPPAPGLGLGAGWRPLKMPVRALAAGGMWVAWPCGLLQSGLMVAALTGSAASGALAMAGFALASAPGLVVGPWVWRRLLGGGSATARERWATRAAGLLLAAGSAWALGHGLWQRIVAYCS
jgi:sulfite exporter TauE/SafE